MQRVVLLLLGMASLVASGVIMDRGHVSLNTVPSYGQQTVLGVSGGIGSGNVLTTDELLRQKFVLDILHQVYMPLQQQDLLMLDDHNIIANGNLYMRPLTNEMQMVLDLIQNNQMLSKQAIWSINNQNHLQQAVGLYKLFVTARDFETFKRLAVYGRQHINTETFVHCLVLALGERQDTQMLVVPALHEIVPQLFIKNNVMDQVRHLDTGASTLRPQLMDIMGMGRRGFLLNSQIADQQQQQQPGLLGVWNKSQLWMPWLELHKQIASRKMFGGNLLQQDNMQIDKLVVSIPGNGLLSQDISLKSYIAMLIDEVTLNTKQDTVKYTNGHHIGYGNDNDENAIWGNRKQSQYGNGITGIRRNNDFYTKSQYGNIYAGAQRNINADAIQNMYEGAGQGMDMGMTKQRNIGGMGPWDNHNRFDADQIIDMDRNVYMGSNHNVEEGHRGFNTVSANDARLLFVGRRRKNPNSVVNMGTNHYDEDELISGGRRVANEESQHKNANNDYDFAVGDMNTEQYINANRREMMGLNKKQDYDDLWFNSNRGMNHYESYQNQQMSDNVKHNYWSKDVAFGMGNDREDFLNMVTRGKFGQPQYLQHDQDLMYNSGYTGRYNRERMDVNLPTININDERLLHVNRHKVNNGAQGPFVYNNQDDMDYQRGNINNQRYYSDEQNKYNTYDTTRRGMQSTYYGERYNDNGNNQGEKHGHRHRRSVVNKDQYLGQKSTVNGKLVLYSIQQLVARLNVERIALGQPQLIEGVQNNIGYGANANNLMAGGIANGVDVQTINEIEVYIQKIDNALQQRVGQISVASYNQKLNEIGLILAGQIEGLGLNKMLGYILQATNEHQLKGLLTNMLENEAAQILLAGIVKVVDQTLQQVYHQREEFIPNLQGVNINSVEVDKLQTYLEQTDVDLTNLLNNNNNIVQTTQGNSKVVVGRVPRLNHKSFNIKIDVTSDRQQQVVVRNLLVPKVDGQNNLIPLSEKRQNAILLDITTVELQQGRNTLKLKSNDITITSRDTTPLTKIYQIVMQALNTNNVLPQDVLNGQSTLLPHHLLLPRGRTNGLPMQMITAITPLQGSSGVIGVQTGNPLNTILLDNLPLNYPFHCDITDLEKVIEMPNLVVKDVNIYHENNIQIPFMY